MLHPIPAWTWTLIALIAVVATASIVILWLMAIAGHAAPGTAQASARLDAMRTGLAAGGGAGAAVGLMLAFRRQHHQEIATVLADYDATQRRITELYGKAADQLGSDKAPVRLAGLYALERLAQESPANRQTIVNLICAYLRMPYSPPGEMSQVSGKDAMKASRTPSIRGAADRADPRKELQVRLAAQRILTSHLGAHGETLGLQGSPAAYWEDVRIDLTGATLVDFDLTHAIVGEISFYGAKFVNAAVFCNVTFTKVANFAVASFGECGCYFNGATFASSVYFGDTSFWAGRAEFQGVTFHGDVRFGGVTIQPDGVDLSGARVTDTGALLQWPAGWRVKPGEADGEGILICEAS